MNAAQKNISDAGSTQKFTEIKDIFEDILILSGGNACLVIEIQASNFALLSKEEQDAKIFSYASLLNSLAFSIQILIRNKKLDISSYLKLLDIEMEKAVIPRENVNQQQAKKLFDYIKLYQEFVKELVKVNTVLDKKFYMIIPYSFLEKGAVAASNLGQKETKDNFAVIAQAALHTKAQSLLNQLARLNLRAKILEKEELIKLLYSIYNEDLEETVEIETNLKAPIVKIQTK